MATKKCIHKGCGKLYKDDSEPCVYHSGPPIFHEGQKGWQCCKKRVLTFDEFLAIPPCTTGTHTDVDDTVPDKQAPPATITQTPVIPASVAPGPAPPSSVALSPAAPPASAKAEVSAQEEDDPSVPVPKDAKCKRRACNATYDASAGRREHEECVHHPGEPIFHEGSKGYTCCKRRVLEFDEFMKIEGCTTHDRHLFVGSAVAGR